MEGMNVVDKLDQSKGRGVGRNRSKKLVLSKDQQALNASRMHTRAICGTRCGVVRRGQEV